MKMAFLYPGREAALHGDTHPESTAARQQHNHDRRAAVPSSAVVEARSITTLHIVFLSIASPTSSTLTHAYISRCRPDQTIRPIFGPRFNPALSSACPQHGLIPHQQPERSIFPSVITASRAYHKTTRSARHFGSRSFPTPHLNPSCVGKLFWKVDR
jgi:hypothetical protein